MKDVNRIRIRKVYASCPGWPSGGSKELSCQTQIRYMLSPADFSSPLINEDLPGQAAACLPVFTFDNRFSSTGWAVPQSVRYRIFRLQASYLSSTSHTGRNSCRAKSLYMKRFWVLHCYSDRSGGWNAPPQAVGPSDDCVFICRLLELGSTLLQ